MGDEIQYNFGFNQVAIISILHNVEVIPIIYFLVYPEIKLWYIARRDPSKRSVSSPRRDPPSPSKILNKFLLNIIIIIYLAQDKNRPQLLPRVASRFVINNFSYFLLFRMISNRVWGPFPAFMSVRLRLSVSRYQGWKFYISQLFIIK